MSLTYPTLAYLFVFGVRDNNPHKSHLRQAYTVLSA